ncbi:MAG: DUF2497 domain-containing protein [Acidiphilium sp.]
MSGSSHSADEPSMDEILSSIRRILRDDEPVTVPPAQAQPGTAGSPVLTLDTSMIVNDTQDSGRHADVPAQAAFGSSSTMSSETPPEARVDQRIEEQEVAAPQRLIGAEAAEATTAHIGALVRTVSADRNLAITRGGPTVEDLVRAELRPLLKSWLDAHLPGLVERIVRAEIERLVGRDGA